MRPDVPQSDPENNDRLGYKPIAKQLAKIIRTVDAEHGFVIAIHGKWGSGKSTLLNFAKHYLATEIDSGKIIPVTFNPWWFADAETIRNALLTALQAALNQGPSIKKKLLRGFTALASAAKVTGQTLGGGEKVLGDAMLGWYLNPEIQQKLLAKAAKDSGVRFLVFMDDIDRLQPDEIAILFRTLKAVAELPEVVYVLAFDREYVSNSLFEATKADGDLFIEKLVQLPIPLPLPQTGALTRFLDEVITSAVGRDLASDEELNSWRSMIDSGILNLFRTPREVVRFGNTIAATFELVKAEVFLPDYIAIEAIKIASPAIFDIVRANKPAFAGPPEKFGMFGMSASESAAFHTKWIEMAGGSLKPEVLNVLSELFPKVRDAVKGQTSDQYDNKWDRLARACSVDHFDTYFMLQVAESQISRAEILSTLEMPDGAEGFESYLRNLKGRTRPNGGTFVAAFLDELKVLVEDTDFQLNEEQFLISLGNTTESLLSEADEGSGFFHEGNGGRLQAILYRVLKRFSAVERFQFLKKLITESESIDFVAFCGVLYEPDLRPNRSAESELTADQFEEVKALCIRRFDESARNGALQNCRNLVFNLYRWLQWGDGEDTKEWVRQQCQSLAGLRSFLINSASRIYSSRDGLRLRIRPQTIADFLDLDSVITRLHEILELDSLEESEREILSAFKVASATPDVDDWSD